MNEEDLVQNIIRHRHVVQGLLTALVGDAAIAEDLFQEVAIVMTRKRADLTDAGRFIAWGRGIAVNVVREWRKRGARRPLQFLGDDIIDKVAAEFERASDFLWEDRREALRKCSETLPDNGRKVLQLRYVEGMAIPDLAASMSMTRGALDTMLYRLRKDLLNCVEGRLQEQAS